MLQACVCESQSATVNCCVMHLFQDGNIQVPCNAEVVNSSDAAMQFLKQGEGEWTCGLFFMSVFRSVLISPVFVMDII